MKQKLLNLITSTGLLITSSQYCEIKITANIEPQELKQIQNPAIKPVPAQETKQIQKPELKPVPAQEIKQIQTTQVISKENKNMSNIKRTNSGLGIEILTAGTGAKPKVGQTVTVHYTGYLDDNGQLGKKFDSSVDRNQPFSTAIGVGRVIAGWDEGLLSMQVGEKCRLYIPANLGYGSRGAGAVIPPNANLIFDVELISVK